jgi:hypothetical protein
MYCRVCDHILVPSTAREQERIHNILVQVQVPQGNGTERIYISTSTSTARERNGTYL